VSEAATRRLAWSIGIVSIALMLASLVFTFLDRHAVLPEVGDAWSLSHVFDVAVHVGIPVLGILVATRRPENPLGWLFLLAGIALALSEAGRAFALHALVADPGSLPGGTFAGWVANAVWPIPVCLLPFLLLLFPSGHLVSSRWRPAAWLAGSVLVFLTGLAFAFATTSWSQPFEDVVSARGPFTGVMKVIFGIYLLLLPLSVVASFASAAARYAQSGGEERLQLKWFATAAALVAVVVCLTVFYDTPLTSALFDVAMFLLYAAIGVAILRYRLYDIDVIINKAVVYGGLAAFITLVYVLVVVVIGAFVGATELLSLVATAIVAVAFQQVRHRMQAVARRLVYGERATPYETLSTFSARVSETPLTEEVLPEMARMLAEGTGSTRAQVWLRVGSELRLAASWPDDGPPARPVRLWGDRLPTLIDASRVATVAREAEVRHRGELLGALTLVRPSSAPFAPAEERLLLDLASQAGLVLRNVALIAELRASRQRLVSAQDQERRKIERNLHDGAQQQLVILAVKLRLIEGLVLKDADRAAELARQATEETGEALESLRDLARGIYPPLLADKGLVAALESQADESPIPVRLDAENVDRYTQEAEAAIYFCCLEALENAAKHAKASEAVVRLADGDRGLRFEVTDDGAGFEPAATANGTGLQAMADRLDAIGGSLEVRSAPGAGTTVIGTLPTVTPP
jgi:signal transduction histidine kinase